MENKCCFCNEIIPEGRIVCPKCEKQSLDNSNDSMETLHNIKETCIGCCHKNTSYCVYCSRNPNLCDNYSPKIGV